MGNDYEILEEFAMALENHTAYDYIANNYHRINHFTFRTIMLECLFVMSNHQDDMVQDEITTMLAEDEDNV